MINNLEFNRIEFIKNNQGEEEAKIFALRTIKIYFDAVTSKKKNHSQIPEYRDEFIDSMLSFAEYLGSLSPYNAKEIESHRVINSSASLLTLIEAVKNYDYSRKD